MGAVGLNFGSATSGQGFDVTSTVTQIVTNLRSVEGPWKSQLTKLSSQDTQLTSLGSQLSSLSSDLQSLTDYTGVLAAKQGSSSDSSALSLTSAGTTATAGTHSITVQSLAQTSTGSSSVLASSDTLSGSVQIQVGSGAAHTVQIADTHSTLSDLAASINAAGIGVRATVLTDTLGARLSLVSSTDGVAGTLTVSGQLIDVTSGKQVNLRTIQDGKDANLLVNGVQLTSASNSVTDAIPGVTFQLLSVPESTKSVQVVIANDTVSVASAVSTLVADYNKVIHSITTQEGKDFSGNAEPLYGTTVLARVQQSLQAAIGATFGSGNLRSAYALGITTNPDGTVSLNTDTLSSVLNTRYAEVASFFQDAGGFGSAFSTSLNNMGNGFSTGMISLALKENKSQEETLNDDVARQESLIATQKLRLTAELNAANQILQAIPSMINQINEMYSAVTGYNKQG